MDFQLCFKVQLQLRTTSKAEVKPEFVQRRNWMKSLKLLLTWFFYMQIKYLPVFWSLLLTQVLNRIEAEDFKQL